MAFNNFELKEAKLNLFVVNLLHDIKYVYQQSNIGKSTLPLKFMQSRSRRKISQSSKFL